MPERRHYILVGHPVRHSVSPAMFTAAFEAMGLAHSYSALDVPTLGGLEHAVSDLRDGALHGINVTIPYKKEVLRFVDDIAPSAQEVGAANVLVRTAQGRIIAHNTDADALAAEIERLHGPRTMASAAIIGAGGAGLAAIVACKRLGIPLIGITTRSWSNSESLVFEPSAEHARELGALTSPWPGLDGETAPTSRSSLVLRLQWCELAAKADVIVQATSAGMAGADPGEDVAAMVPWDMLEPSAIAYDVVYVPRETPFIRDAISRGLRGENGLGMLVGQAVRSFQLWTARTPPAAIMRRAAEMMLEDLEVELASDTVEGEDIDDWSR